jgi:hypothetical protein
MHYLLYCDGRSSMVVAGGHGYDGSKIVPLGESAINEIAQDL